MNNRIFWVFGFIILLILIAVGLLIAGNNKINMNLTPTPTPKVEKSSPTPTAEKVSFCNPSDISSTLTTQGAAGSVYGNFKLTNTSSAPCKVLGNQFVKASYSSSVKNIKVTHTGTTQKEDFVLKANQSLYSQVRMQNGPQCSGQTVSTPVEFTYMISPNIVAIFVNGNNSTTDVQTCSSPSENTQIQIWDMQKTPITQ